MININELKNYIINRLNPKQIEVTDEFTNGLQIYNQDEVKKIAFGVDASIEFMKRAIESGADTVIVHHGINFHKQSKCIPSTQLHKRLQFAFQNRLNVFGFHYLLDSHSELGNNTQILKLLDLEPNEQVDYFNGGYWGWGAILSNEINIDDVYAKLNKLFEGNAKVHKFGKTMIKKIAVITGSGSDSIDELVEKNYDLLITGDISESTQEKARELGINIIWGGHYITEKFGVKALMDDINKEYSDKVETIFIEVPNLS